MKASFVKKLRNVVATTKQNVVTYGLGATLSTAAFSTALAGEISYDTVTQAGDTIKSGLVVFVTIAVVGALCYGLYQAIQHGIGTGIAAILFTILVAGLLYTAMA